jgi:hypothetical protein
VLLDRQGLFSKVRAGSNKSHAINALTTYSAGAVNPLTVPRARTRGALTSCAEEVVRVCARRAEHVCAQ